jgi:hypothetical protein
MFILCNNSKCIHKTALGSSVRLSTLQTEDQTDNHDLGENIDSNAMTDHDLSNESYHDDNNLHLLHEQLSIRAATTSHSPERHSVSPLPPLIVDSSVVFKVPKDSVYKKIQQIIKS